MSGLHNAVVYCSSFAVSKMIRQGRLSFRETFPTCFRSDRCFVMIIPLSFLESGQSVFVLPTASDEHRFVV